MEENTYKYERLINVMRDVGKKVSNDPMQIGIVKEEGVIKIDSMELDKNDYYLNSMLRLNDSNKIYYHNRHPSSGEYMTDGSHNGTLTEYKNDVLYPGDMVVVQKIQGIQGVMEKFIVLAKVVVP